MIFQMFADLVVGMVIRGLEGSYGGAGDFRNVFIFHLIEISHREDQSLLLRKPLYCLVQFPLQGVAIEVWVFVDSGGQDIAHALKAECVFASQLLQSVEGFICGDPI